MTVPARFTTWPRVLRATSAPLTLALAACGGSSGGPQPADAPVLGAANLAVLIAEGDATSEAIGVAYQQAHGIPAAHVLRVPLPSRGEALTEAEFSTFKAAVDARLPADVQATLLTWTQPSRVQGSCAMGLTSALAFGYAARWCGGCSRTATSAYFNSESRRPWTDLGLRPSMMLGAPDLVSARSLIARGVAARGLFAGGRTTAHAWLVRTTDVNRSARHPDFQALAAQTVPGLTMHYVDNADAAGSNLVTGQNDVMFYFTSLASVAQIDSNRYLPGAAADHLTSYGGVLPGGNGQMPATAWLAGGATGSYGTVEEPCNYDEKFPQASVLVRHYVRGQTLMEAYWKSVAWPGQGLFVGDPLARPWAP